MARLRPLAAWFVMLLVSVGNGIVRDAGYGRWLSERTAQQLSTLSGILLLGVVMCLYLRRVPPASARAALRLGLFWAALTVAFEFLFFHYVAGHPWPELLAAWNLADGQLWPLIILWLLLGPWLLRRRG